MQNILFLYITVIATSTEVATEFVQPEDENKPCTCVKPECTRFEVSTKEDTEVKIYKKSNEKDNILCLSSQPIRWTFGTNSDEIPHVNLTELWITNSSQTYAHEVFCLTLRVIPQSPSWTASSVLFVKCEMKNNGSGRSRWYRLDRNWSFEERDDSAFQPRNRWDERNSSNEALYTTEDPSASISYFNSVKTTEEPSISTSYLNPVNHTSKPPSSDNSLVNPQPSVPLSIVIASAGGAAAFVAILLILLIVLLRKVKQQRKEIDLTNEEIDEFMLGVAAEKASAKGINGLFILPYDTRLEIPKADVAFRSTVLGSGAFGQVLKGTYQGNQVAIKTLKNKTSSNAGYLRSLLGELKVMSYLGSHPNLVRLIGAITRDIKKGEAYLIFEYCSHGNAHKFVRDHRDGFLNMLAAQAPSNPPGTGRTTRLSRLSRVHGTARHGARLTTKDLVRWSYEVASGMEYVSSKNVYHGDLAARNILLMEDLTAKVGDFGLSKQLDVEQYNCYVQKKECPLPLKWLAIESLRDLTFSIQSDVWSFGVTMWELFTLGTVPYPGIDWNFESLKLLCEGKRLDRPEYASDSLYNIMMNCWSADPKARPVFADLRDLLNAELLKFK